MFVLITVILHLMLYNRRNLPNTPSIEIVCRSETILWLWAGVSIKKP